MTLGQWLTLVTCGALLALGIVAVLRARTTPLALPLASICLVGFIWNFAVWAHSLSDNWTWIYIDRSASPWNVPTAVHFIFTFVGQRRRRRHLLRACYALAGLFSAVSVAGFFSEWGRRAAVSPTWDDLFALMIGLYLVLACGLLVSYLRAQHSAEEKMRTRLVIAAVVVGAVLAAIELVLHDHLVVPAMLVSAVILAVVAFGLKLFDSRFTMLAVVYAAALAIIVTGGYVVAFKLLAPDPGLQGFAVFAMTLFWMALLLQTWRAAAEQRGQTERLAMLGRLASQMAHDLKNPLAALKGAAQYLVEERAQGRSIDDQREFLDLLVTESERLSRLIDRYRRLGGLQTSRSKVSVNELVNRVLEVHRLAVSRDIDARVELEAELPECALDADLVATAIENVLRNATEAMRDGGTLLVRTERVGDAKELDSVAITVEDSGRGMDARELERAFDEFFSTKATGSGLGLPLVKRVVEAHGGSVSVRSSVGRGTRVMLLFPVS